MYVKLVWSHDGAELVYQAVDVNDGVQEAGRATLAVLIHPPDVVGDAASHARIRMSTCRRLTASMFRGATIKGQIQIDWRRWILHDAKIRAASICH